MRSASQPRLPEGWRRAPSSLPSNRRLPLALRLAPAAAQAQLADPLARDADLALLEAALLVTDEPLPPRRVAQLLTLADGHEARRLLLRLQELYERDGSAFQLAEVAGGFQLFTRPVYHPWLVRLKRGGEELRLSGAARETLAIIAYRQPITRADVEAVRGVQCGETLRLLMEKGLVRVAGREESLGRPVLYGTTRKFLLVYGLKSLKDLPQVEQLAPPRTTDEGDGS